MFGRLAVVSPSVWFADHQIVHFVDGLPKKPKVRIWLDTGTKEGRNTEEAQQTVNDARLLKAELVKKGWQPGKDLNASQLKAPSIMNIRGPRAWGEYWSSFFRAKSEASDRYARLAIVPKNTHRGHL